MTALKGVPVEILLVEDNPADALLTLEGFQEAKIHANVNVVRDGEEAIAFLTRSAGYHDSRRPDMILLDLNLPRLDGREVLAEIKSSPELRQIPVVVMTSSTADADIARTYDLHANCYVTKPLDLDKFLGVIRGIEEFWLTIVRLPPRTQAPG